MPFHVAAVKTTNFNIMAKILVACVKQAKLNENFQKLPMKQQEIILKNVWTEYFVLRASHWPIDIRPVIDEYENELMMFNKLLTLIEFMTQM